VEKMRADIRQYGESRVGGDELHLLCHSVVSATQELRGIAQIAEWERWTFEYQADGSVRFTSLYAPRFTSTDC
jgi:hypothetical protein